MAKYDADWIKGEIAANHASELPLRECSICGYELRYLFANGEVLFDPGCECGRRYAPYELRSVDDIADLLAMQSSDDVRDRIMAKLR